MSEQQIILNSNDCYRLDVPFHQDGHYFYVTKRKGPFKLDGPPSKWFVFKPLKYGIIDKKGNQYWINVKNGYDERDLYSFITSEVMGFDGVMDLAYHSGKRSNFYYDFEASRARFYSEIPEKIIHLLRDTPDNTGNKENTSPNGAAYRSTPRIGKRKYGGDVVFLEDSDMESRDLPKPERPPPKRRGTICRDTDTTNQKRDAQLNSPSATANANDPRSPQAAGDVESPAATQAADDREVISLLNDDDPELTDTDHGNVTLKGKPKRPFTFFGSQKQQKISNADGTPMRRRKSLKPNGLSPGGDGMKAEPDSASQGLLPEKSPVNSADAVCSVA